ncbi:MAG: AAA family ATPase, partial [Ruminococcus sp.]|nr:AAA family ATPase [Ruminococcus sp.]
MAERKKIPIGIEDFAEIIRKNCYFVDKTLMIRDILDSSAKVTLFTRPRRFGKTLNMSMLQRFFENTENDNSYLFDGLNITKAGEQYLEHMGQYPVISISLKGMKQPDFETAYATYKDIIKDEFSRHKAIVYRSDVLDNEEMQRYTSFLDIDAEYSEYSKAIGFLSKCLCKAYNKNVIILIDEYDVPLENSYFRGFYNKMIDLLRSAFESALKTNNFLEFAVLTGCLRISKESIFTGLNNLKVHSVLNNDFSEYFGFTEDEVKELAKAYGLEDRLAEMRLWYDG